jgi:DNA replication and repair protein RecF
VVAAKGRVLRQTPPDLRVLPELDSQLVALGAELIRYRGGVIAALGPEAARFMAEISGGREALSLAYQTVSTVENPLGTAADIRAALTAHLDAHRAAEIAAGSSLSGPHRDDIVLSVDGRPARAFASQGQARSAALALKFAQRAVFHADFGAFPAMLLDDVLSELDPARRAFVCRHAAGGQVLLTCCETPPDFAASARIFL